ncbi:MAG: TM0996/MTH895 family glutaredoxin-like protein [Calditrichaeota bacterium]|nr:TM0996/MTH895 family glutaredoxin-like protein [Calditrichota bacterium]
MKLQVLGTGCPKCNKLAELSERVARENNLNYTLDKVTDINEILAAGVMMTPALMVNGEVKISGRVPTVPELTALLTAAAGEDKS